MTSARALSLEEARLLRSMALFIPVYGAAVIALVVLGGLIAG